MNKTSLFLYISCLLCIAFVSGSNTFYKIPESIYPDGFRSNLEVLIITGGHSFDQDSFFGMFFSMRNFNIDTLSQPRANQSLLSDSIDKYDAIVFYDMWQDISYEEKEAFLKLTEKGTGLVFLHHSIASYAEWDLFTKIRGGKYYLNEYDYPFEKYSKAKLNLTLHISVIDPKHPVTLDLQDFEIHDEGYSNIAVLPFVTPLLTTNHPDCSDTIAWKNKYNNSKIVYVMLGHDALAYSNESFYKVVTNAILWSGK